MNDNKEIFIITWSYYDNSGFGIVGGYAREQDANATFALLDKYGDPSHRREIHKTQFIEKAEKIIAKATGESS